MIDQQRTGKSAIREPIYCRKGAGRPRWSVHRIDAANDSLVVIGVLVAGGLTALAPGANASVPSVSKTCRSLNSLNENLQKALASGDSGQIDTGAISNLSKSFRKAEKTSPKSLKSAENTIADAAAKCEPHQQRGCGSSRNQGSRIETHGRGGDVGDLHRKKLLGSDTLND